MREIRYRTVLRGWAFCPVMIGGPPDLDRSNEIESAVGFLIDGSRARVHYTAGIGWETDEQWQTRDAAEKTAKAAACRKRPRKDATREAGASPKAG